MNVKIIWTGEKEWRKHSCLARMQILFFAVFILPEQKKNTKITTTTSSCS
jgi:hypothetical protein